MGDASGQVRQFYTQSQLPDALRALRESERWTQRELAKEMGTTASAVCRLENPKHQSHTVKTLCQYADMLGYVVGFVFIPNLEYYDTPERRDETT